MNSPVCAECGGPSTRYIIDAVGQNTFCNSHGPEEANLRCTECGSMSLKLVFRLPENWLCGKCIPKTARPKLSPSTVKKFSLPPLRRK